MFLCSRYTEYALTFDMMPQKLLSIPQEALKVKKDQ